MIGPRMIGPRVHASTNHMPKIYTPGVNDWQMLVTKPPPPLRQSARREEGLTNREIEKRVAATNRAPGSAGSANRRAAFGENAPIAAVKKTTFP